MFVRPDFFFFLPRSIADPPQYSFSALVATLFLLDAAICHYSLELHDPLAGSTDDSTEEFTFNTCALAPLTFLLLLLLIVVPNPFH